MSKTYTEEQACTAIPVNEDGFNSLCVLPHGLVEQLPQA